MIGWLDNPLLLMGIRRRLRRGSAIVGALVTVVATAFAYFIVYLTAAERGFTSVEEAAKLGFAPVFLVQGFILIFLGTGAVASGIAEERASGVIDYHRLTPMRRGAKIAGYLYGFTAREYFLFAITLPFTLFTVVAGDVSALRVAQLYLVFFTTVALYHATGMAAGMLSAKPRSAAIFARVLVIVLYIALPNLTAIGFSFLAYLTVIPTFRGLLGEELAATGASGEVLSSVAGWETVPFFTFSLSPTLYTLLMQGLLLATFAVLIHRKWRHEATPAFSKRYAVAFFCGVQGLVLGSLWPLLAGRGNFQVDLGPTTVLIALSLYLGLSAALSVPLLLSVTPSRAEFVKAWRRARSLGLARPHWLSDRATSLWVAPVFAAATAPVLALLCWIAGSGPGLDRPIDPGAIALTSVAFCGNVVALQAARELWTSRGLWLFLGGAWVVPGLAALLLLSVWSAVGPAQYLGAAIPAVQYVYLIAYGIGSDGTPWLSVGTPPVAAASVALSVLPAIALVALLVRAQRRRRREAG